MGSDLPDYTKYITQNITVPQSEQGPVIPRPKGGVLKKGAIITTASYQTVATHTVTAGKTFQLAKILISCTTDVQYRLTWGGVAVSAEVIVPANTPFTDWFPWDYYLMLGDGSLAFHIEAKYPSGGSAGTCHAELVGEEV